MPDPEPRERTSQIFREGQTDVGAFDKLTPVLYAELKKIARDQLRGERGDVTLQPTALVHEAYLRLVDESTIDKRGRRYFFGVAARAMRQILIQHARERAAKKRGGDLCRVTLGHDVAVTEGRDVDILALEEALDALAELDVRQAQVVELRFFGGLSVEEVAESLDVSPRTIKTDWQVARAWLRRRLGEGSDEDKAENDTKDVAENNRKDIAQ